jgi:hypothetical protein
MRRASTPFVLAAAAGFLAVAPAHAQSDVFIEYAVTGAVDHSGRDVDVVMCSASEDGFIIHTLGDWVFTIEADSPAEGEHVASFQVAAPSDVAELRDDNFRTDDRPRGEGTIVIEGAGRGQMNLPLLKVEFAAKDLENGGGAVIHVEGSAGCLLMEG